MITEIEKRKERDYLKTVLYILQKNISKNKAILNINSEEIKREMRYLWEEHIPDPLEKEILKDDIITQQLVGESYESTLKAQERMLDSAYFARIDFDDGTEIIPVYLGIASLVDGQHFYVYDWRAPICSMFYDAELGDAYYTLPNGEKVFGKITLKRQYQIKGDEIKEIFDTELQIIDNILQKMLSGNASTRMKNIVKTIQKEQNKIIRNNDADVLVVQGPAGSGKTSVAMHRIAYLLYAQRNNLKNSNVLIISPNEIFSSYISDVLPSVGEENVYQTTYRDYVLTFASEFKIKGDMNDIYECLYTKSKSDVMYNSICLKFSTAYYHCMDNWIERNRSELLGLVDIEDGSELYIGKEFLEKYAETLDRNLSIIEQAELVNEKIISHLSIKLHKEPKLKQKLIKALRTRVEKIKTRNIYNSFFEDGEVFVGEIEKAYNELAVAKSGRLTIKQLKEVYLYTRENLKKEVMPYEDVVNYLYLKGRVKGFVPQHQIKHVVIDEAQDYTLLQYNLLTKVFPDSTFTLLGDVNQSILPMAKYKNYESIINLITKDRAFAKTEMTYLAKTYRSTYEINTFAKTLVSDKLGYKQVERHGDKITIKKDTNDIAQKIIFQDAIKQKRKYTSVAIICKTEQELQKIKLALQKAGMDRKFAFVTKDSIDFDTKKVQIIPSYIAKGLEFDSVLVYNASSGAYSREQMSLFYVVCTRALHKLSIYYETEPCELLKNSILQAQDIMEQK